MITLMEVGTDKYHGLALEQSVPTYNVTRAAPPVRLDAT
jgi:hypothetical protein